MLALSDGRRFEIPDEIVLAALPAGAEAHLMLVVSELRRVLTDGVAEIVEPVPEYVGVGLRDVPFRRLFAGRVLGADEPPAEHVFAVVSHGQRSEIVVDAIRSAESRDGALWLHISDIRRIRVDGRMPPGRGERRIGWPGVPFGALFTSLALGA